jgi:hypothetical protein
LYSEFVDGGYDCVDRVILNAYFWMGQSGGGLRVWWRELYGSDENLDDNHLMRMAGRFSRRLRAWAAANNVPGVYCAAGERKHEIADEHLSTKQVKPGQTRPVGAQRSLALRESLFLSYLGPGLGTRDDQNEWLSTVRRTGDPQWARISGGAGVKKPASNLPNKRTASLLSATHQAWPKIADTLSEKETAGRLAPTL